jgi:dTDP-4-dehydrorhamnose reductase
MSKNILITGSNGQLGNEFKLIALREYDHNWFFTDLAQLDVTNPRQVSAFITNNKIDLCINCAAYTAVDAAEDDAERARAVNAGAVKILADACFENNALLIHFSTDYVFDGLSKLPYSEHDSINPLSVYGKSKALGERVLQLHAANSIIIRSSWLYALHGHNFAKTIIRLAMEKGEISVVDDQFGTPTWAADLAKVALQLAINLKPPIKEIFHYSNEGVASWYEFASEILRITNLPCKLIAVKTTQYPSKAARPLYSVLNKSKIKEQLGLEIPDWKISLAIFVQQLMKNQQRIQSFTN